MSDAPKNYAEVYENYFPYVMAIVHRLGIPHEEVEDTASEILCRFMELRSLEKFDPSRQMRASLTDETLVPAKFSAYLNAFVRLSVRGHRQKSVKLKDRESLGSELGDVSIEDDYQVFSDRFIQTLRDRLSSIPKKRANDRCDLPALLDAVLETAVMNEDRFFVAELASRFGITVQGMYLWLEKLASHSREVFKEWQIVVPEGPRRNSRAARKLSTSGNSSSRTSKRRQKNSVKVSL